MMAQLFDPAALLVLLGLAALAFVGGLILGVIRNDGRAALKRGAEAAALAAVGGMFARLFIGLILALGGESHGAGIAIGYAFFLYPGLVDTFAAPFGAQLLTTPDALLNLALGVGALAGALDGAWRIHRWNGPGVATFLLDCTWGLAGTTNGLLFHLVNFAWAKHPDEPRNGAHRYEKGFRFKNGFAVTQGSVMSNMGSYGPGSSLYMHEMTHVWQNRWFGPFFTLTYLGWMMVMFVPALIVGSRSPVGVATAVEGLCYYNNPWEAWAYHVGHNHGASPRAAHGTMIWNDGIVVGASVAYFAGVLVVAATVVLLVFL
jgi:hypothetical protein